MLSKIQRVRGVGKTHFGSVHMNSIRVALELNNMSQVLLYANKGLAILKNVDQMNASENEKKMAQKPSIIQQAGGGIEGLGVEWRKQRRTKFNACKVHMRGSVGAFTL